MKKLKFIKGSNGSHWVGDGFPVRNIFSYNDLAEELSPFLMLDYGGPARFDATESRRGVGAHPHRGFETVTLVYDGEVEHRDSAGGGGKIGPGDVQWMTAASGLVHEEFHGAEFAKRGGPFEIIQLWVNLPAKHKKAPPGYQSILDSQIPKVALPENSGHARVIAGEFQGARGPARTFTPMNVWDVRIKAGHRVQFDVNPGDTTAVFILKGELKLSDSKSAGEAELAVYEAEGHCVELEARDDTTILFLSGEPLNEPIVGYGPFVMNSPEEIRQAFIDYRTGRMGEIK